MFYSTKTYGHEIGLSCCFRQHKAESHCHLLHGYSIGVKFVFKSNELDVRNWVVDFGSLKSLKGLLEDTFDHTLLVAEDDPLRTELENLGKLGLAKVVVVESTGCESFAKLIFDCTEQWLKDAGYAPRVSLDSVEVKEHGANSAFYKNEVSVEDLRNAAIPIPASVVYKASGIAPTTITPTTPEFISSEFTIDSKFSLLNPSV